MRRKNNKYLMLLALLLLVTVGYALISTTLKIVGEATVTKQEWNVYWDELPLSFYKDRFDVGIRPLPIGAVTEIDTLDELIEMDSSYEAYRRNRT